MSFLFQSLRKVEAKVTIYVISNKIIKKYLTNMCTCVWKNRDIDGIRKVLCRKIKTTAFFYNEKLKKKCKSELKINCSLRVINTNVIENYKFVFLIKY